MSPMHIRGSDHSAYLPRTCGDEPEDNPDEFVDIGSAPHLRG